jgi:transcriptional regulator with XRE-family HTH domain
MPLDLKEFGRRLKEARTRQGLTQEELRLLISQNRTSQAGRSWISELEHGHQDSLRADTVVRFAEALAVSADYLLGLTDAGPAPPPPRRRRAREATA